MTHRSLLVSAAALLLAACSADRPAPTDNGAGAGKVLFTDIAESARLQFTHYPGISGKFYMPEIMGSGAALLDYDNDGDLDVFLVQSKPLDAATKPPAGIQLGNRLFRNELIPSGRLTFTDVTAQAGAGAVMYGMGAATGDFNNDGFADLYVTGFGPNILYRNNGNGTFSDVTAQAGVNDDRWSTSAAFFDYDRDGDLDLIVLNYVDFTVAANKRCNAPSGEIDYCTPKAYRAVPARLFRNEGRGAFQDVTAASGISKAFGPGLGVAISDVNRDGWLDIYIANDTAANLLWINQRDGTFKEEGLPMGAAYSEDGMVKAGMGVTAGDFDNDGDDDLFVVNLTREGATLFANDGQSGFQDVSLRFGIRPLTFAYTGFGTDWFDYDNDGWLDLFIANGAVTSIESQRGQPYPFRQRNQLLHNLAGKKFEEVTGRAGAAMALEEVTRGAAFGDIDNDGDVDILIANNNGPARLLRNDSALPGKSLTIELQPAHGAGPAQGARVIVERRGAPPLARRLHTDSSYLSASGPRLHVGLGFAPADAIVVHWPDGHAERFTAPAHGNGRVVRLRQNAGQPVK